MTEEQLQTIDEAIVGRRILHAIQLIRAASNLGVKDALDLLE